MQILKRIGFILAWLAGAVLIFAAINKNDPYLISLRGPGNFALAAIKHRDGVHSHPLRPLEKRRCGEGAHPAVVPAIAIDARRACCV